MHWTDVEWQVFLRAVGLFDDLRTGEKVLLQPFLPSGQSLFSHHALFVLRTAVASSGLTSRTNLLQRSLTSPLGPVLSAKRSLLPNSSLFPSTGEGRSSRQRTLGLVCFQSLSYCMCVCMGNLIHLTQIITREGLPCCLETTV